MSPTISFPLIVYKLSTLQLELVVSKSGLNIWFKPKPDCTGPYFRFRFAECSELDQQSSSGFSKCGILLNLFEHV